MKKDYTYVINQIQNAIDKFQLDCCKTSAQLFFKKYMKNKKSHGMYESLLGLILIKLSGGKDGLSKL